MITLFNIVFMIGGIYAIINSLRMIQKMNNKRKIDLKTPIDPLILTFLIAHIFLALSAAYNVVTNNQNILLYGFLLFVVFSILYYIGISMSKKHKAEFETSSNN